MTEKKLYIGSVGPYLFEDDELINDLDEDGNPTGDFDGQLRHSFVSNRQALITEVPSDDNHLARYIDLLSGWLNINIVHIVADYIVLASDCILLVDCSYQNITIYLPAGITKKPYEIVRVDNSENKLTVIPNGIENINNEDKQILYTEGDAMKIISDGSDWYII